MSHGITRRELIKKSALAAGLATLGGVWTEGASALSRSPNGKLNLACVGCGGQGASDIYQITQSPLVNVVALCDVDSARASEVFNDFAKVPKYKDFRVMLEKEAKNIDAVTVSTPDHIHAVAASMAMKLGKHVYVQKPLTHTVAEARSLMMTARKMKVVTQMGTQGHPAYWRLVEFVNADVIGPITEVHVQTDRPAGWWPQGIAKPTTVDPVPSTLDWDLWLGPAAKRPYNKAYLPFVWRGWWDFGTGSLGDMACHLMDGAFLALKLKYPTTVDALGDPLLPDSGPNWLTLHYEFPARGSMPPVSLYWYDGGQQIPMDILGENKIPKDFNGSVFVGKKGKLFVPHGGDPVPFPKADFKDFVPPPETLPRPEGGHYMEWVNACIQNKPGTTGSTFDYAAPMTESVLLGNVAFRTGQKIEYDWKRMEATNVPEAEQFIKYKFSKGYKL